MYEMSALIREVIVSHYQFVDNYISNTNDFFLNYFIGKTKLHAQLQKN